MGLLPTPMEDNTNYYDTVIMIIIMNLANR